MTEVKRFDPLWIDEYREILDKFEEAIAKEPNIPQNMPRISLIRFLQVYDFDVEKSLKLLKANVKFRSKHPLIFSKRDLCSAEMKSMMNTIELTNFPSSTSEGYMIYAFRIIDQDSKKFHINDIVRLVSMFHDTMHVTLPKNQGDVFIFDSRGFSFWHFLKVVASPYYVRTFLRYEQEATACRIKQNHIVNCSPILKRMVDLLRPFINQELAHTFHFHTNGLESLYEFLPKELLPAEYGGTAGNLDDYWRKTIKNLDDMKDYLLNDDNFFLSNK